MNQDELLSLRQAVQEISDRLSRIESRLGFRAGVVSPPSATKETSSTPLDISKNPRSNSGSGGKFLGGVGIFFFILATSFFIKLAIDSGWLTPIRQLAGAIIFGATLIGVGFQLQRKDFAYSALLPAAGIIVLFMSAYAGHLYYHFYGAVEAALVASAVALLSIYLFRLFKHEFFLVAGIAGTYLIPIFIGEYRLHYNATQTQLYFIIWNIVFCTFAVILKQRLMIALTAYFAIGIYHFVHVSQPSAATMGVSLGSLIWPSIFFQCAQFVILSCAVAIFSIKNRSALSSGESWALLPVLLLFYTVQYSMLYKVVPEIAPWISLSFSVVLMALYIISKKALDRESLESAPMLSCFVAISVFHSVYLEILPEGYGAWFALILGGVFFALLKDRMPYKIFWPAYFILYALIFIEYFRILPFQSGRGLTESFFLNSSYFLLIAVGYFVNNKSSALLLILAKIQALSALHSLAHLFLAHPISNYVTSALWAIFALATITYAHKVRDRIMAKTSVLIFGFVAFKVLTFDLAGSGSLSQIVALILIGALLYSGGLVLRKINSWENNTQDR